MAIVNDERVKLRDARRACACCRFAVPRWGFAASARGPEGASVLVQRPISARGHRVAVPAGKAYKSPAVCARACHSSGGGKLRRWVVAGEEVENSARGLEGQEGLRVLPSSISNAIRKMRDCKT
jgi:hypothetical protein